MDNIAGETRSPRPGMVRPSAFGLNRLAIFASIPFTLAVLVGALCGLNSIEPAGWVAFGIGIASQAVGSAAGLGSSHQLKRELDNGYSTLRGFAIGVDFRDPSSGATAREGVPCFNFANPRDESSPETAQTAHARLGSRGQRMRLGTAALADSGVLKINAVRTIEFAGAMKRLSPTVEGAYELTVSFDEIGVVFLRRDGARLFAATWAEVPKLEVIPAHLEYSTSLPYSFPALGIWVRSGHGFDCLPVFPRRMGISRRARADGISDLIARIDRFR